MRLMKEKREKANLTQEQLAIMIGVNRTTITKIENGSRPSIDNAQKIARILSFDWTEFFKNKKKRCTRKNEAFLRTARQTGGIFQILPGGA